MFTAYFDDSGSEETPAFAVAGHISTADQWIRFEQEWKEILVIPAGVAGVIRSGPEGFDFLLVFAYYSPGMG